MKKLLPALLSLSLVACLLAMVIPVAANTSRAPAASSIKREVFDTMEGDNHWQHENNTDGALTIEQRDSDDETKKWAKYDHPGISYGWSNLDYHIPAALKGDGISFYVEVKLPEQNTKDAMTLNLRLYGGDGYTEVLQVNFEKDFAGYIELPFSDFEENSYAPKAGDTNVKLRFNYQSVDWGWTDVFTLYIDDMGFYTTESDSTSSEPSVSDSASTEPSDSQPTQAPSLNTETTLPDDVLYDNLENYDPDDANSMKAFKKRFTKRESADPITAELSNEFAKSGDYSAKFTYDLSKRGWGSMWVKLDKVNVEKGITFWAKADVYTYTTISIADQAGSGFDCSEDLELEANKWTLIQLSWDSFKPAAWSAAKELSDMDLSVTYLAFGIQDSIPDTSPQGSLWLDDISFWKNGGSAPTEPTEDESTPTTSVPSETPETGVPISALPMVMLTVAAGTLAALLVSKGRKLYHFGK